MSWQYRQSTGNLLRDGALFALGYSGHGTGLDNPLAQNQHALGPIPQGKYTILPPHVSEKVGPIAMSLIPHSDNQMYGRGDFLIHGDNQAMNQTASNGCIIMPRNVRIEIGEAVMAGDDQLEVIE